MSVEQQNRNCQETASQQENVQDVEQVSPNRKRKQQKPAGQTKRRRGNAQDDVIPSSLATLPRTVAPDLNHDTDTDPDPGLDLDTDLELSTSLCPDPIYTRYPDMNSVVGNWDHVSGQIFPTPPSSSLGVNAAPDPHLSDAYRQAAYTQFVEALPVNCGSLRAPIFQCYETIPFPQRLLSHESSGFSAYKPTMPVCTSSSACNQVEELPELNPMSGNTDYHFIS